MRSWTRPVAIALGTALVAVAGCAAPRTASAPVVAKAVPPPAPVEALPEVPVPQTQPAARRALELGFGAQQAGDAELAAAHFDAVLASDFLTDAGRMNVYWQCARSYRELGDVMGERNALEGFLLAAQLVPLSDDDLARTLEAESILVSLKRGGAPVVVGPGVSLRTKPTGPGRR